MNCAIILVMLTNILCTISLAISDVSHLFVLTVEYRTISIAMTRTGNKNILRQMRPRIYRRHTFNLHL